MQSSDPEKQYLGNYFTQTDINRLLDQHKDSGDQVVDLFLTGQWPLNISGAIGVEQTDLQAAKQEFYASSENIQHLVKQICPRYAYSSNSDTFYKRTPYINQQGFLTRFIALGSLPGPNKPQDSKSTYV